MDNFCLYIFSPPLEQQAPQWVRASSFTRFLDHTQRCSTVGRTPLDELSARRRDLYLTTHDTHNRQTSMHPGKIRTHNLSRRAAEDLRLRPRGHWDRLCLYIVREIPKLRVVTAHCTESETTQGSKGGKVYNLSSFST